PILFRAQKSRAKHRAELTTAELETLRHQLMVKPLVRVGRYLGRQQLVITLDRRPRPRTVANFAGCGDVRGSFAMRIAMSAICSTVQSKNGCVSELMSMSGAGFMKSMA